MMKDQFAQTGRLFTFSLKREWVKIIAWLVGLAAFVFIGIFAYVELYSDAGEREMMAMIMSNPAIEAIFGPVIGLGNYTIGAMYSHTMTILILCLFAIMSILLVVSNTKTEEEEGILELLRALPIGRLSHTTVGLLLLVVTNILISGVSVVVLYGVGDSSITLEGALLTGVMYGSIGLFFGAVALLMGQLSNSSRNTMIGSFALLGFVYILRIIGDTGYEILSWISPLGLLYRTEPFVENNWWPVILLTGATALIVILALTLQGKRDMGAGLIPEKSGTGQASAFLKTPFGFSMHLLKTPLIVWLVALVVIGITYGSVIGDVEGMLDGNEVIEQIIGSDSNGNMVDQFLGLIIGLMSILAAIPALQAFLRLKTEETSGRVDNILSGNFSRTKILMTFLFVSFLVSIIMQFAQLLAIGGTAVAMDFDVSISNILEAGMIYLPAIWISIGVGVFLYGWLPKLTSIIWGYLGFAFVVLYFADLIELPEWIMSLSAFYHIPQLPQESFSWGALLVMAGIAVVLSVLGVVGFKRRDIAG